MNDLLKTFTEITRQHVENLRADPELAATLDRAKDAELLRYADSLNKTDAPLAATVRSGLLVEIDETMVIVEFTKALAEAGLTMKHRNGQPPLLTWAEDCDHQFRQDLIDPYAVSCVKCGKLNRFPKTTLKDRQDFEATHGDD